MKKIYILIPIILILFLSIGFSAFTNNLLIDDMGVVVRPISNIRVTGVNYSTNNNGGVSNNIDYNTHNINDINSMKVLELHICKGEFGDNYTCN